MKIMLHSFEDYLEECGKAGEHRGEGKSSKETSEELVMVEPSVKHPLPKTPSTYVFLVGKEHVSLNSQHLSTAENPRLHKYFLNGCCVE